MKCQRCGKPYTDKQDQYTDGTYARSFSFYPDCDCSFLTYEEVEKLVVKLIYAGEKHKYLTPNECRFAGEAVKKHKKFLDNLQNKGEFQ